MSACLWSSFPETVSIVVCYKMSSSCLIKNNILVFILTNNSWFQVYEQSPWDMFVLSSCVEEGIEGEVGLVFAPNHHAVGLYAVFQAIQLPGCVAHLDASLAHVNADAFSL